MFAECEVCGKPAMCRVVGLPGIAMSAAMCTGCEFSGAIPLKVLIANTVLIGGMSQAADWWFEVMHSTMRRLNLPTEQFYELVEVALAAQARQQEV